MFPRALRAAGGSAGRAAPGPEPVARLGWMGSPSGRVPASHTKAQGGLGSTKPRCPRGRPGTAAPVCSRSAAPNASACAAAASLSRQAPPATIAPKMSAALRPPLSAGRGPSGTADWRCLLHSVPGRPRAPAAANSPATAPLPGRAPGQTTPTPL